MKMICVCICVWVCIRSVCCMHVVLCMYLYVYDMYLSACMPVTRLLDHCCRQDLHPSCCCLSQSRLGRAALPALCSSPEPCQPPAGPARISHFEETGSYRTRAQSAHWRPIRFVRCVCRLDTDPKHLVHRRHWSLMCMGPGT